MLGSPWQSITASDAEGDVKSLSIWVCYCKIQRHEVGVIALVLPYVGAVSNEMGCYSWGIPKDGKMEIGKLFLAIEWYKTAGSR